MKKLTIHGLPITPRAKIEGLAGASFCVSYATCSARTVNDAIRLVGKGKMLLVDNGAYSHWRKTGGAIDLAGFAEWANDISERCPEAVVVLPDVIDGTAEENCALVHKTMAMLDACDRAMPVWHMHEPIVYLLHLLDTGFNFIAIGSSGAYGTIGTAKWHARIRDAMTLIEDWVAEGNERPRIHMMRGNGMLEIYDFDSADSCTVAMNHWRRGRGTVSEIATRMDAGKTKHEIATRLEDLRACTTEFAALKLREFGFTVGYADDTANDNEPDLFDRRAA